jgi:hypothetical protein
MYKIIGKLKHTFFGLLKHVARCCSHYKQYDIVLLKHLMMAEKLVAETCIVLKNKESEPKRCVKTVELI